MARRYHLHILTISTKRHKPLIQPGEIISTNKHKPFIWSGEIISTA
jgi:hypothetical protein